MKFDSTYQAYSNYPAKEVPDEDLKHLVYVFVAEAALNMGSNVEKANVDRIIEIIKDYYGLLPVYVICSAFIKGSMGYLGEGRLIPKNVNAWLREIRIEHERQLEHKKIEEELTPKGVPVDLKKYPMGKAINKKIEWVRFGLMTIDQWDHIPLKELAEAIGRGDNVTTEKWL